jgi:hypothetical protein
MDKFISEVNSDKNLMNNKRILLFSFPASNVISRSHYSENFGWYDLHDQVHESFVELAVKYPELEFIIKHKGVNWESTRKLLERLNAFNLANLKIFGNTHNAQKLILESDVVTGFGSTALLEAGIALKPVIYPLFAEATKDEYKDFVCFENAHKLFDIANSKEEFKKLIIEKIKTCEVSEAKKKYRFIEFENQVSSLYSDSVKKYSDLIITTCKNNLLNVRKY